MKFLPLHTQHFEQLYSGFEKAIHAQGYAGSGYYASMVREFLFFIETKNIPSIQQVKAPDVIAYYDYLQERPNQRRGGGLSDSAIRQQIFSLRLFFDHLVNNGVLTASPLHLPKISMLKYNTRNIATQEEIKQIYKACENRKDRAIVSLAYGCGLRRSEIEQLNVSDVIFHQGILVVRAGKFGKSRTIPLSCAVMRDLRDYIVNERAKRLPYGVNEQSPAFILNKAGRRMNDYTLNLRLKEIVKLTGNQSLIQKNITLHCLRHSIATHLLDNGANIEFVQKFLGHVMMDTTHLYSKRRKKRQLIREAVEQYERNKNLGV